VGLGNDAQPPSKGQAVDLSVICLEVVGDALHLKSCCVCQIKVS